MIHNLMWRQANNKAMIGIRYRLNVLTEHNTKRTQLFQYMLKALNDQA